MNENETKQIDYNELADYLVHCLCLLNGSDKAIELLVEAGYDADQIENIGFEREDIDLIINQVLTIPKNYNILYKG